jgi:hypothetical protein
MKSDNVYTTGFVRPWQSISAKKNPEKLEVFLNRSVRLFSGNNGGLRAINQLNISHRRVITWAETALHDTQVATWTGFVTRPKLNEQLTDGFFVTQARHGQTAVGHAIDFADGDQRLGHAAEFLGFRQGGADQFVLEQRRCHIDEHSFAVGAGAAEFTAGFLVTHDRDS